MDEKYISLSSLAENMVVYERLPVPIQEGMRRSIRLTLITNVICIPLLILLPSIINSMYPVSSGGFFIWFTADAVNLLFEASASLSAWVLALNIVSLLMIVSVLVISQGITQPVQEPVHWLAWAAAFPSGISALSVAAFLTLFFLIVVVSIVIWVICLLIGLAILSIWAGGS